MDDEDEEEVDEEKVADAVVASPAPVVVDSHRAFACDVDVVCGHMSLAPSIHLLGLLVALLYLPPITRLLLLPPVLRPQAITYLDERQRPALLLQEGPHVCYGTC